MRDELYDLPRDEHARAYRDEVSPDARRAATLLDGIPGAYERTLLGLEQARAGQAIPLDKL